MIDAAAAWAEYRKADDICRDWANLIPPPPELVSSHAVRSWLWGHPLDRAKLGRRCKAKAEVRRIVAAEVAGHS